MSTNAKITENYESKKTLNKLKRWGQQYRFITISFHDTSSEQHFYTCQNKNWNHAKQSKPITGLKRFPIKFYLKFLTRFSFKWQSCLLSFDRILLRVGKIVVFFLKKTTFSFTKQHLPLTWYHLPDLPLLDFEFNLFLNHSLLYFTKPYFRDTVMKYYETLSWPLLLRIKFEKSSVMY